MDKEQYMKFSDAQIGSTINRPVLVSAIVENTARNGNTFVKVSLKDGFSEVTAMMFDASEESLASPGIRQNTIADAELSVSEYQGSKSFKIVQIRPTADSTLTVNDFTKLPPVDLDLMYSEIFSLLESSANDYDGNYTPLSDLALKILTKYKDSYMTSSAAISMHHNLRGGLLYHSYRMVKAADALCGVYTNLDRELLLCGTALHDIGKVWEYKNVIADTLISADTKFFVVKLLQEKGYTVTTYGDGKNDYYMLKQADKGYLYIGKYLSRSLRDSDLSGISLIYDRFPYILADNDGGIADDIAICKSDSSINGSRLADAHIRLGRKLGEVMRGFIPNINAAVIILERGGRFFGDGVYTGFGGTFYSYNPKTDALPDIQQGLAVIVDSVINTGKSVIDMARKLKHKNPDIEIVIVSNVIQNDAVNLLQEYKVFAVRTSANSFVGSKQATQKNGKGPDTADRLFNYID